MAGEEETAVVERAQYARTTFEANLPWIRGLLHRLGARHHLSPADAEGFSSYAMRRMREDDYAFLRRFTGRSTLHTYLIVVTCSLFLDYRAQQDEALATSGRARVGEEALR